MKITRLLLAIFLICSTGILFGQSEQNINVQIVRDESNGRMNIIPCRVVLEALNGKKLDPVQIVETNTMKNMNSAKGTWLIGGYAASYALPSGSYRVNVLTPIAYQGNYFGGTPHDWTSKEFRIEVKEGKDIRLYVIPAHDGDGYSGGWILSEYPEQNKTLLESIKRLLVKANPTYFHSNDKFIYIGWARNAAQSYYIIYSTYIWGNSRATHLLSILNSKWEYMGNYSGVDVVPKMKQWSRIEFETGEDPKLGTGFDLANGPPPSVYIDGELYAFESQ